MANDQVPDYDDLLYASWTSEEIRRVGYSVVDSIAAYLTELPGGVVFRPFPQQLTAHYLDPEPPERGTSFEAVLDLFSKEIAPFPFGNGNPRFFGWVNSAPTVAGIFAEALAAAMNPSCAGGNHAAIHLEHQVRGWFTRIVGFPDSAAGLLVSGGSMAALTGLAVARHVATDGIVRSQGLCKVAKTFTVYKSGESHSCYQKAVELIGLSSSSLRTVSHDPSRRMDPASLTASITRDRDQGCIPMAVIANAGTVNTGAIDPLDEIAEICGAQGVWLHVDGAYGAPAILVDEYRDHLSPIAQADSVSLDPHKWLSIPIEAGLILVKDSHLMRQTSACP